MEEDGEQEKEKPPHTACPLWSLSTRRATSPFLAIANLTGIRRKVQGTGRRHEQSERNLEDKLHQPQAHPNSELKASQKLNYVNTDGQLSEKTTDGDSRQHSRQFENEEPENVSMGETSGIYSNVPPETDIVPIEKGVQRGVEHVDDDVVSEGAELPQQILERHGDIAVPDEQKMTVNVFHIINSKGVVVTQEELSEAGNKNVITEPSTTNQDYQKELVLKPKSAKTSHPADDTDATSVADARSPVLKGIVDKTWQLLELSAHEVFIPTKAVPAAERSLVDLGVVIVTGRSGDGKTALCYRVLKRVAEDQSRIPLVISTPDEWKLIPPSRQIGKIHALEKYVVLIDDIFGRTNLSRDDLRMWERELATMWPLVETGQVLLLIASRSYIFKQCYHNIKHFRIFASAKEISLNTVKYSLKFEEKMCIMEAYLKLRKCLMMSHKDMSEAVRTSGELGFPQICKFYISSREAQKRGLEFFSRPLQYLMDEIKSLGDLDPHAYIVLLLLTFNKGVLRRSDLDPFSTKSRHIRDQLELLKTVWNVESGFGLGEVWKVAERMCNVYLTTVQDCYRFSHQSIYETVVLEFASKYPRKGIEIAPVDILVEFFWTDTVQTDRPVISIVVTQEYYVDLARRILGELKSRNTEKIMDHPALKDVKFLKCMEDLLSNDDKWELSTRTVPSTYTDMGSYTVFSNDYIIWKFKGQAWRTQDSVNTESISLPLRELHVPSLFYIKGHQSLAKALQPSLRDKENIKLKTFLSSSAFVGDKVMVEKLLDAGVIPDKKCILAALLCSRDNDETLRKVLHHSCAPELDTGIIQFCLKYAVHCKKSQRIKLLTDKLPSGQTKRDVLEIVIKLVFVNLVSKPGYVSPFITLPEIDAEQTKSSSVTMFQILRSAEAPWDPVKSLLLVSETADIELLKTVVLELSRSESSYVGFPENDLETDSPCSPVSHRDSKPHYTSGHVINTADVYGCTALHNAAYSGTVACVEHLLEHGANVFIANNIKETPVHEAAQSKIDCREKLKLLLSRGANIDTKDAGNRTPLHALAMKGLAEDFQFFVERGADINATDNLCQTPLHLASCVFTPESSGKIKLLVDRRADINAVDRFGCTALIYIAEKGTVEVMKYLVEKGAEVNVKNTSGKTALHKAAASCTDSVAKMELLLNHKCCLEDVDDDGWTALLHAAAFGTTGSLEFLVGSKSNIGVINNQGQSALHLVCQLPFTSKEKLNCLIKSGTNMNAADFTEGSTPLHCAAGDGSISAVEILLENKVFINIQDKIGLTPLHRAAQSLVDPGEKVQALIDHGADTNTKDQDGHTPLFHAAKQGTVESLKVLVHGKADLFVKGHCGQTVLHKAVQKYQKSSEKVEFLLHRGIDVNAVDDFGNTPLHFAALEASFNTLKCLVDNGANIECANNTRNTPLHNAVKSCIHSKEKILYLVKAGANIYAKDTNNDTALHFAADDTLQKLQLFICYLGVNICQMDKGGDTLLYRVAMSSTDIKSKTLLLLEQGADINAVEKHGWNLTHWVIPLGSGEELETLLDMGANHSILDNEGSHLIHKAAKSRTDCLHKLKLLLERGVSVNIADGNGCTPLHIAADQGTIESVEFLVKNGANIFQKNGEGQTALDLSMTSKYDSHLKTEVLGLVPQSDITLS